MNKDEVINAPPIVNKITAMTNEFPFSNAMSEITHRIYKSEFMGGKHSEDLASHIVSLNDFMEYYNYNRYPCRLYGKRPLKLSTIKKSIKLCFLKSSAKLK